MEKVSDCHLIMSKNIFWWGVLKIHYIKNICLLQLNFLKQQSATVCVRILKSSNYRLASSNEMLNSINSINLKIQWKNKENQL